MEYTPEQIVDVKEREAKALEMLKSLQLTPAAVISKVNLGDDTFGDKLQCYLRDLKYSDQPSTNPEVNPNVA
jgi:hypothetical protein